MADDLFENPRLAAVYDALESDRSDLDMYVAIVSEQDARCVLDVGCGTGTFALMIAERGLDVVGWILPALLSTSPEPSLAPTVCGGSTVMPTKCRMT